MARTGKKRGPYKKRGPKVAGPSATHPFMMENTAGNVNLNLNSRQIQVFENIKQAKGLNSNEEVVNWLGSQAYNYCAPRDKKLFNV